MTVNYLSISIKVVLNYHSDYKRPIQTARVLPDKTAC